MPELPEVESVVCELRKTILGKEIQGIRVYLSKMVRPGPKPFSRLVKGQRIEGIERLGKYIILVLRHHQHPGLTYIVIHLKMTGQLLYGPQKNGRPKYVHAKIAFRGKDGLLYRDIRQFGFLHGMAQTGFDQWKEAQKLGPDPLELSSKRFAALLRDRRGRIKPLLLNQKFIRGLGNIYVDESLFAAGIHPLTPAMDISTQRGLILHREMVKILKKAIRLKGSTISNFQGPDGQKGQFQQLHRVYRRQGQGCPVCGHEIARIVVAGRGTHLCPSCQKIDLYQ
jgi:formamidopyrimidine-DNA glycosylase